MEDLLQTDLFAKEEEKRFINLTPLIDMMFQLVTFLMLTTNLAIANTLDISIVTTAADNVQVPPSATAGDEDKTMFLKIESAKQIFINDSEFNLDAMAEQVRAKLSQNPGELIVLKAGDGAKIQDIVTVMDRLNGAGINNLSFSQD